MAIYLGAGEKVKIVLNNKVVNLIIPSPIPILNGTMLMSFDNYILKDSNGLYLTAKEDA